MQISEETIGQAILKYFNGNYVPQTMDNVVRGVFANDEKRLKAWQGQIGSAEDQQWNQIYKKAKADIGMAISGRGWRVDDSGAWLQFQKTGTMQKVDGKTHKRYYSFAPDQMANLLKHLPWLADSLGAIPTQGTISFKIPSAWGGFMQERDSLVVHFYDPNIIQQVDQAVQSFVQKSGLQILDRNKHFTGASDVGVDINGQSDTQLLAQRFMRNVDQNKPVLMQMAQTDPQKFEKTLTDIWKHIVATGTHR